MCIRETDEKYSFGDFMEIVRRLRAPDGCPWDSVQTHASLRQYMIEEAYEAVEGMDIYSRSGDASSLKEELGDVLLQIVLHSLIAQEEGAFTFEDVVDAVSRKMIFRHPHVFGDGVFDREHQQEEWEKLKKKEKGDMSASEQLSLVPKSFPSLLRAQKLIKKRRGLPGEDDDPETAAKRCEALLARFEESADRSEKEEAAAGLLIGICRLLTASGIEGEHILRDACVELEKP